MLHKRALLPQNRAGITRMLTIGRSDLESKDVTLVSFFITYNGKANSVAWELDIMIGAFLGEKVN